jgi:hypothetical protein
MTEAKARKALQQIALAIRDTVKEAGPMGAPSGHLYAAMMATGCTLDQYQQIIAIMVRKGMIRQQGDLLFA